jgi:hypothetical protein
MEGDPGRPVHFKPALSTAPCYLHRGLSSPMTRVRLTKGALGATLELVNGFLIVDHQY